MLRVNFPKVVESAPVESKILSKEQDRILEEKPSKIDEEEATEKDEKISKDDTTGVIKHVSFDFFLMNNFGHIIKPKEKSGAVIPLQDRAFLKEFSYSYKLNLNCQNHEPYPKAMCSACIPPSILMKRQVYRHVDYAQIMNSQEIGNLIKHWFNIGTQRIGFLYGYYATDPTYKMGVRAVVEAIYEPAQQNDFNNSIVLPDNLIYNADRIAQNLGLQRIGFVFTTYNNDVFMTSEEVIWFIIFPL